MAEQTGRQPLPEQEGSSPLELAGIVGGAALGYKYRRAIGKGIKVVTHESSMAMRGAAIQAAKMSARNTPVGNAMGEVGSYLKSLDHALDQKNPLFHMRNKDRFDNRFTRTFKDLQEERMRMARTPLGGKPTKIQNEYLSMMKGLQKERKDFVRSTQFEETMKRLSSVLPEKMKEGGLENVLRQKRDDLFFESPSLKKVDELLKMHSRENAKKNNIGNALDFVDELERKKTAETVYQTMTMVKKDKNVKEIAKKNYKEYRDIRMEAFKADHSIDKNGKWMEAAQRRGLKPLTLKETLNRGLIDQDSADFLVPLEKASKMSPKNLANNFRIHMKSDKELGDLHVDPGLFLDKSGNVVDMRNSIDGGLNFLDIVKDNVQLPYLRFNPLDLAHYSSIKTIREAPKSYVLKRGDIDPFLQGERTVQHPAAHNRDAAAGTLADDHIFVGGNVYRMHDMSKVDEGVYLADRRFGVFSRMPASMANLHVRNYDDVGPVKNFFGFGLQESPSSFANIKSMFTKFKDPDWEINQVRTMMKGQYKDLDEVEGIYKNLYSSFNEKTTNFSSTTIDFLNPHVKKAYGNVDIDLTKLNTTDEIMGAVGRIRQAIGSPEFDGKISKGNTALAEQFDEMWTKFSRSPQGFLKNKRISSDNGAVLPEFASALETGETELVGILDDAKRLIQQHSIHQVNMTTDGTSRLVRNAILEGDLDKNALGEVRNMEVLSKMRTWWKDVYRNRNTYGDDALEEFAGLMKGDDSIFGQAIHQSIKEFNPLTSTGPGMKPPNYFGPTTGYGIMRDAKGIGWAKENYEQLVEDGSSSVSAFLNSTKEVLKQPFAGRNNLGDVTTATTFFYYGVERMDNALSKVGLGLAQKDKGSMQSILVNQLGKRILLPYVAYKELEYLDDMTGDTISDSLADTYVNMHGDLAGVKETLGINRIGKELTAPFAGAGQLGELPFLKAFDFLTLGAFSDFRSEEEVNKYYESGEDAVRKGRYWGLGSNTPWAGGKIERWEPNWYRKAKSDYEYTDTLYGSANDYWANTWIPTLSNPLAPLTYMINGHSYLEKKHEEDRPYPIKGGTILSDFPIVGPLADNTIGRIISPRTVRADLQEQHERYQDEVIAASSRRFDAYSEGASIQLMPAGGMQVYEDMPSGDGGYEEGYGSGGGGAIGLGGGASAEGGVAIEGTERMVGAGDYSSAALTAINQRITMRGQAAVNQSKMRPLTQLESLRDPEALADLSDIGEIGNPSGVARDMFYSASEVLGIYGFGTKALSGFQEGGRGLTLEPSSRMDSMARSFWDMELGGADMVGGGFSEIFRRYIPRDPNKNYYNPIRNTMPDWMPGAEYFLPFKYGDPYVKVSKGEMRLPGEAYESLYKLHPDEFSQEDGSKYGAFDRFRILADVAPYSDQYRMWKRVVSQMNQDGRLTDDMKDEYQEVMTQVRERKKKYQFFDKRFTNADIDMQDVTVTKILDQNTFLTEEFPNNPIKLAGVSIKKDDEEAQSLLRQFVYEGAKIRVGLDADPLFRVRDDMMNTMRAVVYAGNSEEGMPFYMTQKGQNVNYMLANRSFGGFMGFGGENNVSVKDDGSATATQALFSNDQITVGKTWEFLSHDLLPSLPIIRPIADKFLQVRSPLEQYKRTEVYGKAWRPWEEPISGWLQPMIETMASRNPLIASAQGYGIGWLAGRGKGKYYGKWIGALVGGGAAALRVLSEHTPGNSDVWLPERRKKEREVNEYFDRLKYMKFKGLYEKAAEEAKRTEGVDLKELLDENSKRGKKNKQSRKTLELYKKQLAMQKKMGYGDDELTDFQLKRIRENLKTIGEDRSSVDIGPHTLLALQYKAEYESTLFGADPNGDMTKIFRSLPKKDREYFAEFMKAAPDEREEILRLVPENERRFFQAKWGMKMDEVESNESYFKKHYLPSENWEGWRADTALNDIKLKVVRNEGMELTEFGFWGSDETRADASGVDAVDMQPRMMGDLINSSRIEKILRGAGLDDVQVTVQRSPSKDENMINVGFDMMKDRSAEIIQELNTNWTKVFS